MITSEEIAKALARASAALVDDVDVQGTLIDVMQGCRKLLGADASAILLHDRAGLQVAVASSHRAAELELHQSESGEGPCAEAFSDGQAVEVNGTEEIMRRWPAFGRHMHAAGFTFAYAAPLRWRGEAVGALGLFWERPPALRDDDLVAVQAFADIATLAVARSTSDSIDAQVESTLQARVVIEQAKGVIAEIEGVDMSSAYETLLARSAADGASLGLVARLILQEAHDRG